MSLGERLEAREEGVEVQREAEVAAHFFLAHKLGAVGEGDRQGQLDACLAERYRQLDLTGCDVALRVGQDRSVERNGVARHAFELPCERERAVAEAQRVPPPLAQLCREA